MGEFRLKLQEAMKELPTEYEEKIRSEIEALYKKRDMLTDRKYKAKAQCDLRIKQGLAIPESWQKALQEIVYQEKSLTQRIHSAYDKIK